MACHHSAITACVLCFQFHSSFWLPPLGAFNWVCNSNSFGFTTSLDSYLSGFLIILICKGCLNSLLTRILLCSLCFDLQKPCGRWQHFYPCRNWLLSLIAMHPGIWLGSQFSLLLQSTLWGRYQRRRICPIVWLECYICPTMLTWSSCMWSLWPVSQHWLLFLPSSKTTCLIYWQSAFRTPQSLQLTAHTSVSWYDGHPLQLVWNAHACFRFHDTSWPDIARNWM